MMEGILYRSSDGAYAGYQISGHALFADPGQDVVCAAVSMLAYNTANSIELLTGILPEEDVSEGYMKVMIPEKDRSLPAFEKASLLIQSLKVGLDSVRDIYGSSYMNVRIENC